MKKNVSLMNIYHFGNWRRYMDADWGIYFNEMYLTSDLQCINISLMRMPKNIKLDRFSFDNVSDCDEKQAVYPLYNISKQQNNINSLLKKTKHIKVMEMFLFVRSHAYSLELSCCRTLKKIYSPIQHWQRSGKCERYWKKWSSLHPLQCFMRDKVKSEYYCIEDPLPGCGCDRNGEMGEDECGDTR